MTAKHKPTILFAYFTYTKQTLKVVEAMSEVLQRRGCDVHRAAIEFQDPRYAKRFETFPMPRPFLEVLGMIPAELRRRPAKIGIGEAAWDEAGRRLPRRHPLPIPGRPGAVAAVVDQLPRLR